jgi:carbonic anhydrase
MRISRLATGLLTAGASMFSVTLASAQAWNHNPASAIGPNQWGSLSFPFATCGAGVPTFVEVGQKQSPINIDTATTIATGLPALAFHYRDTPYVVENTSHNVEVPYESGSGIRVGQDTYGLSQFHFHAPSEHMVNGQLADAELHLVHRNSLLDNAVVGVLLRVGAPVNAEIEQILFDAPFAEGDIERNGLFITAKDLLPQGKGYYTYSGSLTTPPCSEVVRWFVLKEPVFVSQGTIDRLHQIISAFPDYGGFPNNNRPVRPLNGRAILNK